MSLRHPSRSLVLSACFAAGTANAAAEELPLHVYSGGTQIALTLDLRRIALCLPQVESAEEAAIRAAAIGMPVEKAFDTGINDCYLIHLSEPVADAEEVNGWLEAALAERDVAFAAPVFESAGGHFTTPTREIILQFAPESMAEGKTILAEIAPQAQVVEENHGAMSGAFLVDSASQNGFEVLASSNQIAADSRVRWSEPNMLFSGSSQRQATANDPHFPFQWGLRNLGGGTWLTGCGTNTMSGVFNQDMDADFAWLSTTGVAGIKVLVLDTGVESTHPDLVGRIAPGFDTVGGGGAGNPVNATDNHGTAVAGCIVATRNNFIGVAGVAPGCQVLSARAFNSFFNPVSGQVEWSTLSTSTTGALALGLQNGAKVSNNSNRYNGYQSIAITNAYTNAYQQGMVHFASAGNDPFSTLAYPAVIPVVNAVAALNVAGQLACFSTFGPELAFAAPGSDIATTDRTGAAGYNGTDYAYMVGTSFASPLVAGVAALILSQSGNSNLPPWEVERRLRASCRNLYGTGWDTSSGFGFVNAYNAVTQVYPQSGWMAYGNLISAPPSGATASLSLNATPPDRGNTVVMPVAYGAASGGQTGFYYLSTGRNFSLMAPPNLYQMVQNPWFWAANPSPNDASGNTFLFFPIPNQPSLDGLSVEVQSACAATGTPTGFVTTNGVTVVIG